VNAFSMEGVGRLWPVLQGHRQGVRYTPLKELMGVVHGDFVEESYRARLGIEHDDGGEKAGLLPDGGGTIDFGQDLLGHAPRRVDGSHLGPGNTVKLAE